MVPKCATINNAIFFLSRLPQKPQDCLMLQRRERPLPWFEMKFFQFRAWQFVLWCLVQEVYHLPVRLIHLLTVEVDVYGGGGAAILVSQCFGYDILWCIQLRSKRSPGVAAPVR